MTPESARHPTAAMLLLTGLLAVLSIAVLVGMYVVPRAAATRSIDIVVPDGTRARMEAGEEIVLFPRRLEVGVGDRIVITNDDAASHQVGPYVVGSGQQIVQIFSSPGIIEGICTLHPSGEVTIVVR